MLPQRHMGESEIFLRTDQDLEHCILYVDVYGVLELFFFRSSNI